MIVQVVGVDRRVDRARLHFRDVGVGVLVEVLVPDPRARVVGEVARPKPDLSADTPRDRRDRHRRDGSNDYVPRLDPLQFLHDQLPIKQHERRSEVGDEPSTGRAIDGIFGRASEACVIHFQWRHGLNVNGVVGQRTRAALGPYTTAQCRRRGADSQ
jgi:peptidoglycan hydrolase-like protein with peptidoglycan-binding domain